MKTILARPSLLHLALFAVIVVWTFAADPSPAAAQFASAMVLDLALAVRVIDTGIARARLLGAPGGAIAGEDAIDGVKTDELGKVYVSGPGDSLAFSPSTTQ